MPGVYVVTIDASGPYVPNPPGSFRVEQVVPVPPAPPAPVFSAQFIADIYAALKTFDGAAVYTPGVAVVTDGSYGPSFSGVMSGSLTGVVNPEDYEVRIYHVADIGYFRGTGVFSYADIGFTGSYGYSYSGSVAGTVANYSGSSAQYRVDVYVRTDADYFQQSSYVFIANLAWGGSYAYGYTGSVFGRVTDLNVAEFGSYQVGVYARIPGDADYLQGTSSIDTNGWFSVNPVFSGDKVAKLERLSDSEIFGQTDTAGSNAWASNQGLDPGIKVAKIVRLSDDRVIASTDSAGAGKWTFGDSGTNCRLIQLYQRSNGSLVAETYFGQGLLRSYNVPLSDPDWWVLGHRNYTYDQAAAIVAACQMNDLPTAERWVRGLMAAIRADSQWAFSVNAISGLVDDGYYRNGAQFWCGYALLFFIQKFPASPIVPEVTTLVQRWLTAMEVYWKTGPDFQQNTYVGGRGRYSLPLWEFDSGYVTPWSSTEHNTDAYFAIKLAGTVLGAGTLVQRAADIGASLQTNYWFSGSDRGYQGQSNGTTHDSAHALDVGSWLSFVFRSLGDSAKQQACVDITAQYAVSASGVTGYTAYLPEYGYPSASDSLWIEGTFGVVLAKYSSGAVAQAITEYNQLQPLLTGSGFSYVTLNDPANELRDWTSVASTAWGIIAARPGGFWEVT